MRGYRRGAHVTGSWGEGNGGEGRGQRRRRVVSRSGARARAKGRSPGRSGAEARLTVAGAGAGGRARVARAGALEGRCTHVKLRTPLFRRPHAAEKKSPAIPHPSAPFRRRELATGARSPERLRRERATDPYAGAAVTCVMTLAAASGGIGDELNPPPFPPAAPGPTIPPAPAPCRLASTSSARAVAVGDPGVRGAAEVTRPGRRRRAPPRPAPGTRVSSG